MKLINDLKHKITVTNEEGNKVEIFIDNADMIQANTIGLLFKEFQALENIEFVDTDDFEKLLAQTSAIAEQLEKINSLLDLAFGKELREKAFLGSSSITLYNSFFEQLTGEFDKAGLKTKEYIKEVRKQQLLNKGKTPKDTI